MTTPTESGGGNVASSSAAAAATTANTTTALQFHNELYRHERMSAATHSTDPVAATKPWFLSEFLLHPPTLFGTWDGVFSSCVIHLFGVIVFLRTGWMVGNAGVGLSLAIVAGSVLICSVAALAAIFISQRCAHLEGRGTIHFLMSHVLGTQIGGAVSVAYCFGQAVSCALHAMALGESVVSHFHWDDPEQIQAGNVAAEPFGLPIVWIQRIIAAALVVLLMIINVAGVKWVVRVQFLLLLILGAALVDFTLGVVARSRPESGVLGLSLENLEDNFPAHWVHDAALNETEPGEPHHQHDHHRPQSTSHIFTVFGVFFPAVTGVMAGINMSGDIAQPDRDIPVGTLAAILTSTTIYVLFVLGLGGTCDREALLTDMMIAEKVSFLGVLLLAGLYMSSVSHCLGSMYTGPRILQNMASENVLPVITPLSSGHGPNKVPIRSLLLFGGVTLTFISIGGLNALAPVVTIVYLLTYAAVEYAYFSLAMTFDIQRDRDVRYLAAALSTSSSYEGDAGTKLKHDYGATKPSDLDRLFPERRAGQEDTATRATTTQYSSTLTSPAGAPEDRSTISSIESTQTGNTSPCDRSDSIMPEIKEKPAVWWSSLENRWIAIVAAALKVAIMFCVQWSYALSLLLVVGFVHFYIGQVNPGAFPGISEFKLVPWLKYLVNRLLGKPTREYEHIVVTPARPNIDVQSALVSEEGRDYSSRDKYHQTETKVMEGKAPQIESD